MIYILMIWTVVGVGASAKSADVVKYDWRSLGEFSVGSNEGAWDRKSAHQMCEDAAKQLGLKSENYRCVRSK
jgi:hypothetical protein